jgi:hypothetical protein
VKLLSEEIFTNQLGAEEGQEAITGWCVSRRNRGRERRAEEGKRRSPVGGGGLVRDRWAVWCVTGVRDRYSPPSVRHRRGDHRWPWAVAVSNRDVRLSVSISRRVETEEGRGERKRRSAIQRRIFFLYT